MFRPQMVAKLAVTIQRLLPRHIEPSSIQAICFMGWSLTKLMVRRYARDRPVWAIHSLRIKVINVILNSAVYIFARKRQSMAEFYCLT